MRDMDTRFGLKLTPGFEDGDGFYAALVEAIEEVGDEQAPQFLTRLVLLLANQVGQDQILRAAVDVAKEGLSERVK